MAEDLEGGGSGGGSGGGTSEEPVEAEALHQGGTGKGGTGRKASKASKGRTGRGRSQCDIRTKIDINQLTNQNLIKDDLATVAYFVQELRGGLNVNKNSVGKIPHKSTQTNGSLKGQFVGHKKKVAMEKN